MIHVLSIGTDRKLFEQESAVRARTLLYGEKIGHMAIIVFSLRSHNLSVQKISPEVTIYPTQSSSRWMYVYDAIRLGKKIVTQEGFVRGASVVTCQDPFECGFVGWRIARHFRLALHLQVHTDFLSPYFKTSFLQRIRVFLGKFLIPRAHAIRVVSKRIEDSLRTHGVSLRSQPVVLPIRVSLPDTTSSVSRAPTFPQFDFIMCMASRLENEKRITDALRVCAALVAQFPKVGLVIVGSGSQEHALKKQAKDLGIEHSVVFVGWVDSIIPYIQSAHVFLSTSEYEGYGMSVIEAGLLGVPVVTTDVGIAGELLVDGKNALVCPVGDVACLTRGIIDVLAHNDKRHVLSMALREDIKAHTPSLEAYVDAYVHSIIDTLTPHS